MWINLGKLLLSGIWGVLVFNLIHAFPKPMNHFLNIAMIFMVFIHGMQLVLLKAVQPQSITGWQQVKIFLFGVFEVLHSQKKQQPPSTE